MKVSYKDISPVIVTIEDAIKNESYHDVPPMTEMAGDVEAGLKENNKLW